jgi:hypothetical protein
MAQVRLPRQRSSETVSVLVAGYAGRVTVVRPDDRPPQVHLMAGGHGSTVAGVADAIGAAISLGLASGAGFDDYRTALELLGLSAEQLDRD